jgi:hypothetical protein
MVRSWIALGAFASALAIGCGHTGHRQCCCPCQSAPQAAPAVVAPAPARVPEAIAAPATVTPASASKRAIPQLPPVGKSLQME